jgi:hypothetical protein
MSYKGVFEFCIGVVSFRNIDLYYQGLYCLRVSLHALQGSSKVAAYPYNISTCTMREDDPHHIFPAFIQDSTNSFCSRVFFIRYTEESAVLRDAGYFRAEVDVLPSFHNIDFLLTIELLFCDLGEKATQEKIKELRKENLEFEVVCSTKFQFRAPIIGMSEYLVVGFEDGYNCNAHFMILGSLLDYKLRFNEKHSQILPPEIGDGVEASKALAQLLFVDSRGNPKELVGAEETDTVYEKYVEKLIIGYRRLSAIFTYLTKKCLFDGEKEIMGVGFYPPKLNLPGNHVQKPYPTKSKTFLSPVKTGIMTEEANKDHSEISLIKVIQKAENTSLDSRFSKRLASHDPRSVCTMIMREVSMIAGQLFQLWHRMLEFLTFAPRRISIELQKLYTIRTRQLWNSYFIQYKLPPSDIIKNFKTIPDYQQEAEQLRNEIAYPMIPIIEQRILENFQSVPIIIEEITASSRRYSTVSHKGGRHIIVMVHGYQGNSLDMRQIKSSLSLMFPNTLFLNSSANEQYTDGDIWEMGDKLANEVKSFISENCPSFKKISFIGFSLGGLIIRAALPRLRDIKDRMHTYMSICTPHLGYLDGSSFLVGAGMWILKKINKGSVIQQLNLEDGNNVKESLIYRMSNMEGFEMFNRVVLISSHQDTYVPFDSARVTVPERFQNRSHIVEMVSGLCKNIKKLYRLNVQFRIPEKWLDAFIGRAAHIEFIENRDFFSMLGARHPDFFS